MEKEQEVIKNIKIYIHDWINESVDEDGYERYAIEEYDKEFINDIETVLSMLKENSAEIEKKNTELAEKNAEIERLEKVLDEKYIFVTEARTVYARLMSLDKEDIVKNDLALRNEIYQHIEDNEKKDKIIDLMAEEIKERKYVFTNKTKKEIKQYFESKVKE